MAAEAEALSRPKLAAWALILGTGLTALSGRWDLQLRTGAVAFLLNGSLALLCLPTLYFSLRLLAPGQRALRWTVLALSWAAFFLPYHALGWDAHQRSAWNLPLRAAADAYPQVWLGEALSQGLAAMPHEKAFMAVLWLALLAVSALFRPRRRVFWALIVSLLALSTWMHLSGRSPYTYLSLVQDPPVWYANNLCPEAGQCLVEGDYTFFAATEDIFRGQAIDVKGTAFIRRPIMIFLSSQLSAFINPLYVYLALNLAAWLAACALLYRYVQAQWDAEMAAYATVLMACAPGMITYVAQPVVHGGGLAAVAIALGLFEAAFAGERKALPLSRFVFFGAVLGVLLLVYDHFPQLLFFAALAWLRRLPWKPFLLSLALGVSIYAAFNLLVLAMRLPMDDRNATLLTGSVKQLLTLLRQGQLGALVLGWAQGTFIFLRSVLYSHFFLVPALALLGLAQAPRRRPLAEALLLLVPAYLTVLALHWGGMRWYFAGLAELPRFAFVAYPGLFILAALGLSRLGQRWGTWAPRGALAAMLLLTNLDAFGGPLTVLYYHFQWP